MFTPQWSIGNTSSILFIHLFLSIINSNNFFLRTIIVSANNYRFSTITVFHFNNNRFCQQLLFFCQRSQLLLFLPTICCVSVNNKLFFDNNELGIFLLTIICRSVEKLFNFVYFCFIFKRKVSVCRKIFLENPSFEIKL